MTVLDYGVEFANCGITEHDQMYDEYRNDGRHEAIRIIEDAIELCDQPGQDYCLRSIMLKQLVSKIRLLDGFRPRSDCEWEPEPIKDELNSIRLLRKMDGGE